MEALVDAVDFSNVAPVILGVGVAIMALYVIILAVQIAVGFVRDSGYKSADVANHKARERDLSNDFRDEEPDWISMGNDDTPDNEFRTRRR